MEIHLRTKHGFPTPAMAPAIEISTNTSSSTTTCLFCLFVLLLYVPSQQLWSLQDGQFT